MTSDGTTDEVDRRALVRTGTRSAAGVPRSWDIAPAIAATVPIAAVIVHDPWGWTPFTVSKWYAVLGLGLLAAAVAAWERQLAVPPRWVVAWLAFLTVVTASAIDALDRWYAWVGMPLRHLGVATWWFFGLMFLVGVLTGAGSANRLLRGALVAGGVLAAYVLVELAWRHPVLDGDSDRLLGPFGSSAQLGAAAALTLPIAVGWSLARGGSVRWRAFAVGTAGALAVAVVGSGSRAALVGLVVSAATVVVIRRRNIAETRHGGTSVAALLVVAVGAIVAAGFTGVYRRSDWVSRLDEWRLAGRVIAADPVLGVGPEGYRIAAFGLVDDEYVVRYGDEVLTDRAHSGLLDVAASSGVGAGALYLVLLAFAAAAAVSAIRSGRPVEVGAGAAVIAYAVQQQFLFPLDVLDPVFWLFVGALVARRVADRAPLASFRQLRMGRRVTVDGAAVTASVFVVLAIGVGVLGVRAVAADRLAARQPGPARGVDGGRSLAEQAADLVPNDIRHHLLVVRRSDFSTLAGVDAAREAVDRARSVSPGDPIVRITHADVLSRRASVTGSAPDRRAASRAWSALVADAPSCRRCHLGAGYAALERGDVDTARRSFERAAALGSERASTELDRRWDSESGD